MNPTVPTQHVFTLVLARPVITAAGEHPSLVHLWWHAPDQGDRLVQVYVDGLLVFTTADPAQREMWLTCDRSVAHRIELLAVSIHDTDAIHQSHPHLLMSWSPRPSTEIDVRLLRDESLAVDTRVTVRLNDLPVAESLMWGPHDHRAGFGSLFGEGSFGHDDATGPGLGAGGLGQGALGSDGGALGWRIENLPAGENTIHLAATNAAGFAVALPVSRTVVSQPLPLPPSSIALDSNFVLSWTE